MLFSERLKYLIDKKGIEQQELAIFLNLSKQAISAYVNGRRIPNDEIKIKLAEYFNVTVDYLVGKAKNPQDFISGKDYESAVDYIKNNYKSIPNGTVLVGDSIYNDVDTDELKKALDLYLFRKKADK